MLIYYHKITMFVAKKESEDLEVKRLTTVVLK